MNMKMLRMILIPIAMVLELLLFFVVLIIKMFNERLAVKIVHWAIYNTPGWDWFLGRE